MSTRWEEEFAFWEAAENGDKEKITDILDKMKIDINMKFDEGKTILHAAASKGHEHLVDFLCRSGADIDKKTNYGWTPLHSAVIGGNRNIEMFGDFIRITEILLKKGAYVNGHNQKGRTPLHHAARIDHFRPEIVRLLLDYGADVNAVDWKHATPIFHTRNEMILEMLIERGANVNYISRNYKRYFTPLSYMVKYHQSCAEVLLRYGADVNIQNYEGETILEINCPWTWRSHKKDQILESVINRTVDHNLEIHRLGHYKQYPGFIKVLSAIIVKRMVTEEISIDVESLEPDNPDSRYHYFCSIIPMCETEINRMKNMKIDVGELSVFDVLAMPINKLLDYVERKELLTLDNVEKDFPFYARILRSHIRQARERRGLVDSSAEAFEKLIFELHQIKLPDLVVHKIVSMLSNGYLTILAKA